MPREGDGTTATLDPFERGLPPRGDGGGPEALVRTLNDNRVDYLLIGGSALHAHGYQRATTDIDLMVPADREHGERVREALLLPPDEAAADIDPAWFEDGENIRVADALVADLMLGRHARCRRFRGRLRADACAASGCKAQGGTAKVFE